MESHMDLIRPKRTKNVYTKALPLWLPVLFWYRYQKRRNSSSFLYSFKWPYRIPPHFCVNITIMASLACILHTIVLAPCSKDAYTSFLWTNISQFLGQRRERRGAHCPRGSSILPGGHQEVCCGGGNSPFSSEYGSPCPRGGRHVRDEGVPGPGRLSCSEGRRAARPSELVTFARRRGAVRSHSKPSARVCGDRKRLLSAFPSPERGRQAGQLRQA